MFNIQDSKANTKKGNAALGGELFIPLIEESEKGQEQKKKRRCCPICCCCCCNNENGSFRRRAWAETIGGVRLISMVMAVVMLGGALYLDDLIIATPNIVMKNPNSPDTEDLLVPVDELTIRVSEIDLKVSVSATTSSEGYLEYTVKYLTCRDYDNVCNMLLRDGKIWFVACIVGMALALPGAFLQAIRSDRVKIMKLLSFLTMLDILILLGVWWLEVYLTLVDTKTAKYPFYSSETNETTLIELTFEEVEMYPSYSLGIASMSGVALCSDFVLSMCI